MNDSQLKLIKSVFILYVIVYAILAYIGGSTNVVEWGVNAKLLLVACLVKQCHFHIINGY